MGATEYNQTEAILSPDNVTNSMPYISTYVDTYVVENRDLRASVLHEEITPDCMAIKLYICTFNSTDGS